MVWIPDLFNTTEDLSNDNYFKIVLRCAALFHDIGHGPLSHLFDEFFPSLDELEPLIGVVGYEHIRCWATETRVGRAEPIEHEMLSCIIATRVLVDIGQTLKQYGIEPLEIAQDICAIIDRHVTPSKRSHGLAYNVIPLFHDIISSDIDIDRMDYLLRDSHMCGVNYGVYDPDRILKSMCAYATLHDKAVRAAIRYSGVGALEDLLIARYQMHSQIYGHKTNRACSTMLDAICHKLKEVPWKWFGQCQSLDELIATFGELDDQAFIKMLRSKDIDRGKGKVKEIAEKLFVERKLIKRVFEQKIPCTSENQSEEELVEGRITRHMQNLSQAGIWAKRDTFKNKGPRIKSSNCPLKVLRKHAIHGYYLVHEVKEFSTVAHYLPEVEKTYRIYTRESAVAKAKSLMPV
jgi:HD superfamily phosphohydrolase